MIRATHSILAAVAAAAAMAVATTGPVATAQQAAAESTLLQLNVTAVPEAGVGGFSGELGSVSADPGDELDSWNQGDPGGVLSHVKGWYGPAPPRTDTARTAESAGSREASASWSGFGISAPEGGPNLLSFGSLHPTAADQRREAYAATDSGVGEVTLTIDVARIEET
ncbi:hypothetical protein ABT337_22055 [Saccharopolyspora hirsuta]|uniref:hypothetical protein n=1 Tax=Saccharopolyspora hirsuta TaxID=1837 RepID=UPI003333BDD8